MHKDPNLRKRNALVIPGGLLTLVAVIGMIYVVGLRSDAGTCEDASLMVFAGACRSALLVLAIPLVIGLAMLGVGVLKFRSKATCRLGHGSWAHFGLATLISLVVLPAIGALAAPSLLGEGAAIASDGVDYPVTTILAGIAGVGLVALVPYGALYVGRNQANRCCAEKGCFDPCFCDEPVVPAEAPPLEESLPPQPEPEPLPPARAVPPPAPTPAPEPAPEPAPATEGAWEEVPAEEAPPAGDWEEVPDDTPEMPEPAPEPKAAQVAPPLASRPREAGAKDPEALAAKWAKEDEEAARELREAGSDPPARSARRAALAKPAKKPEKKHAKKKGKK